MNLFIENDSKERILFVYEVDKLSPEEVHIEVSTAIEKERERRKDHIQILWDSQNIGS